MKLENNFICCYIHTIHFVHDPALNLSFLTWELQFLQIPTILGFFAIRAGSCALSKVFWTKTFLKQGGARKNFPKHFQSPIITFVFELKQAMFHYKRFQINLFVQNFSFFVFFIFCIFWPKKKIILKINIYKFRLYWDHVKN